MCSSRVFAMSALASVFLAAAAHADDTAQRAEMRATRVVYQGNDTRGAVYQARDSRGRTLFLLTITDPNAVTFTSSPLPASIDHPRLNWTALIGTGEAAAAEQQR